MTPLLNLLVIALTVFGLWGGAVWVVESASRIAKRLGVSELVIGLTIVAIATSAPEFAVTVSAALSNKMSISVGNVVGSNIFNLGVILGLVAIFGKIHTNKTMLWRDGSLLLGTGILLTIFFADLSLSLVEGIILFGILIGYITYLIRKKESSEEEVPDGGFSWWDIPKMIIGVGTIILSAKFLVGSASDIARHYGVSEWMIGITIVAAGTSVPELATSIVALARGKHGISVGNLIGSDLFNMLGVLGVASILHPLSITRSDFYSIAILAGSFIVLMILIRTRWSLSRWEGILLIILAFARWWIGSII